MNKIHLPVTPCGFWLNIGAIVALLIHSLPSIAQVPSEVATHSPQDIKNVVYFIGDVGESSNITYDLVKFIKKHPLPKDAESSIIFLGDNIYPSGLPGKDEPGRAEAEAVISGILNALQGIDAKVYFIPGNHDWANGKKEGLRHVISQDHYIEKALNQKNAFLPKNGCPGPEVIQIDDDILLIVLDTQWWLHGNEKSPTVPGECKFSTPEAVIDELADILANNEDKKIIIAGHHPLISDGNHGGYFSFNDHMFPLTNLNKSLYVPLPVIGSLYPLLRNKMGNIQDLSHPSYNAMVDRLLETFSLHHHLIYASGHEHALQYHAIGDNHHIVSGSGSKTGFISQRGTAEFAVSEKGFFRLIFYNDGSVWTEAISINDNDMAETIFTKKLDDGLRLVDDTSAEMDVKTAFPDTARKVVAGPYYETSPIKQWLLGAHYRQAWATPITAPVIKLEHEHGGLSPIQQGGGMQTKSLRLAANDGHQYVFRTIQKYPIPLLPDIMQETFAADILQDQISSSHPYGAFVIPPLADAAGIFHTSPRLVVVPDDYALKQYREEFAGQLVLFEERADEDLSDIENFGYTHNAISTDKMIAKVLEDHDVLVDEYELAKNRLFDMFLGDWDRHEDQWRWAEFKCKKENHEFCAHLPGSEKIYVPIPRDRDQAFSKFDGLLPSIANRKWMMRKFQHFDYDIRDIIGINSNARHLDRSFLTRLHKSDWLNIANDLQQALTDEVIENAIHEWPHEIYQIDGAEITAKLKSRRDKLTAFADRYYEVLAKAVSIVGSDKNEFFDVDRINDDSTSVKVHKIKKGEVKEAYYERYFRTGETNEIRLYGLKGGDRFEIKGKADKGIRVRVIDGEGMDVVTDSSHVSGLTKKTIVYDIPAGISLTTSAETRQHLSDAYSINKYDRRDFKYDVLSPNLFSGFNVDNGFFIGGGATFTHHGFRKEPYASYHRLLANYATRTKGFNMLLNTKYIDVLGKTDAHFDMLMSYPRVNNFFGYGNETAVTPPEEEEGDTYELRFNELRTDFLFVFGDQGRFQLKIGPKYQLINLEQTPKDPGISSLPEFIGLSESSRQYAGLTVKYDYTRTDNALIPSRGLTIGLKGEVNHEISGSRITNARVAGNFSLYVPLSDRLTYAFGTTGMTVFNDFEFYHAARVGGPKPLDDNGLLRGYRRDRFIGRSALAFNQELRLKLFDFKSYIVPGSVGILGFYDVGRVWYDGETSGLWHQDFGGGLWIAPFDMAIISANYAISPEQNLFTLVFRFLF